jgi:hypothetical protein
MQQTGYRVSREEQSEMDAEWQDFKAFAQDVSRNVVEQQ